MKRTIDASGRGNRVLVGAFLDAFHGVVAWTGDPLGEVEVEVDRNTVSDPYTAAPPCPARTELADRVSDTVVLAADVCFAALRGSSSLTAID